MKGMFALFNRRIKFFALAGLFFAVLPLRLAAQFYWEDTAVISAADSRFPRVVENGKVSYILWQEVDTKTSRIWLSCRTQNADGTWRDNRRFAGPLIYSGEVPDMYSAALSDAGTLAVVTLSGTKRISVFVSTDGAQSFTRTDFSEEKRSFIAPRIYCSRKGKFYLFTSLSRPETEGVAAINRFYMYVSTSQDGTKWSNFSEFAPSPDLRNPFAPVFSSSAQGDFVVFQAQYQSGGRLSYQLYSSVSENNGNSWSHPVLLTDFYSTAEFTEFNNQRPFAASFGGKTYVAWERRTIYSDTDSLWLMQIDKNGAVQGSHEAVSEDGNSKAAVLFQYQNKLSAAWFDSRTGTDTAYMAQKDGLFWEETQLSSGRRAAVFVYPLFVRSAGGGTGKALSFIWQENPPSSAASRICYLAPDNFAPPPVISPVNYKSGSRTRENAVSYRIALPQDSSGITGYTYSWSNNPYTEPPEDILNLKFPSETRINVKAAEEGKWYFKAKTVDEAGNWSKSASSEFVLDLTPPKSPRVTVKESADSTGFLPSNTFALSINPAEDDDDVAGYVYSWEKIADVPRAFASSPSRKTKKSAEELSAFAERLLSRNENAITRRRRLSGLTGSSTIYKTNLPNALYVLSVSAVDKAGNTGEQAHIPVLLNKYVPHTSITEVRKNESVFGDLSFTVYGTDFTFDGTVTHIYIDKDGKAPYDLTIDAKDFKLVSNSEIGGINIGSDLETGSYYVGLNHSDRGVFITHAPVLTKETNGTVKIESGFEYVPSWQVFMPSGAYKIQTGLALFIAVVLILIFITVLFAVSFARTALEIYNVRQVVNQLEKGELMDSFAEAASGGLKSSSKKGSLKYQMIGFTVSLIILVTLLVTVFLSFRMLREQRTNMLQGLENRADVLLSSISSSVKTYLPEQNVLELSELPPQSSSIPEVDFVTVTGFPHSENAKADKSSILYVWASNDPDLQAKIGGGPLSPGFSHLDTEVTTEIEKRCAALNAETGSRIAAFDERLERIDKEYADASTARNSARIAEIRKMSGDVRAQIKQELSAIERESESSVPDFHAYITDTSFIVTARILLNLIPMFRGKFGSETKFLLYRPVIFRSASSKDFVNGILLLQIDISSFAQQLVDSEKGIMVTAGIISLAAIAFGVLGAVLLANVIVRPLKKLEAFVGTITSEKHKEKLAGEDKNIQIKRNDEIGSLGLSMNRLKEELARAAREENLQNDGKSVQKAFLPLLKLAEGGQQTIASFDDGKLNCFGYYEGASAVSGDYFDYKKLDERWYVLIKCDASGHGVPAGLIMTVVATLFRRYFEQWSFAKEGTRLNVLVTQINDLIESIGLKGKFATIIVCLFDSSNGDLYMCNAGDNIVHIYDSVEKRIKILKLFETPAAGPLPSFMVDMRGGFKVEKTNLKKGDVLLLYTDGIEESTRFFRDGAYRVIHCAERGLKEGDEHGNHLVGAQSEQLEADRVQEILESVFNRRKFSLPKYHNPIPTENLEFDFSTCEGTIEEAIIALVSVEKVFRMYKSPAAQNSDTVRVDRRIDAFLKDHFNLYAYYCRYDETAASESSADKNYIFYTNLMEDDQADDLTLLAIRRM